jgi:hypothetical protein
MATDHYDDPSILDDDTLLRRIHLAHIVEGSEGRSSVSSAAFRDTELSVNLESVMRAAGRRPSDALWEYPNDYLASITVAVSRSHGQLVGPDPLPSEPAHAYAFGKKTKRIRRALRDAANWVAPEAAPSWEEVCRRKQALGIAVKDAGED